MISAEIRVNDKLAPGAGRKISRLYRHEQSRHLARLRRRPAAGAFLVNAERAHAPHMTKPRLAITGSRK
jgi:hypothetical protein